jgi:hypothetical protein
MSLRSQVFATRRIEGGDSSEIGPIINADDKYSQGWALPFGDVPNSQLFPMGET